MKTTIDTPCKTSMPDFKVVAHKIAVLTILMAAFAASAEIQYANEFWVSTNATGNFPSNGKGGTLDNPYDGSTQANFDMVMHDLCWLQNNRTIHIMPGTYMTKGSEGWVIEGLNIRIIGSGMDVTTLKVQDDPGIPECWVVGMGSGVITSNSEVCDMT